jgi:hypothetical protein
MADRLEWEGIIANPQLAKRIITLQTQLGLPVQHTDLLDWMGWKDIKIDTQAGKIIYGPLEERRQKLYKEIKKIADDFSVPARWLSSLESKITTGNESPDHLNTGFPSFRIKKERGQKKLELIITEETDAGNPMLLQIIKQVQAYNKSNFPQSLVAKNGDVSGDQLATWSLRHPSVTHQEIADSLGYNRVTVTRKINQRKRTQG